MSRLIVVSAPSGAGKTTLCQRLLRDFPNLTLSISATTRAPRGQEVHGREYYFLQREEFEKRITASDFAEWAKVHDHYYGTLRTTVRDNLAQGRGVLLDIDVQGAASLRKAFPDRVVSIFVAPPTLEVLRQRLLARGTDDAETIEKRMKNAEEEMLAAPLFDHVIVNDQLERAYHELAEQVRKALHV